MKAFLGTFLLDVAALGIGFLLTRWVLRQSTPAKDLETAVEFLQPVQKAAFLALNRTPVWFHHAMGIDTVYLTRMKFRVARGHYDDDKTPDRPECSSDSDS